MKQLLLLRHAQALPAQDGSDIHRNLSPKGAEDALALGHLLKSKSLYPDHVLCSSAQRTQETCAQVLQGLEISVTVENTKEIYNADVDDLLALIHALDNQHARALMIGHNPSIYELAYRLSQSGQDIALRHLTRGYAPASLSFIQSDTDKWAHVCGANCSLEMLLDPIDYNAATGLSRGA